MPLFQPLLSSGLSDPRSISGLQAWYDANQPSSITYDPATGAASIIGDVSGNSPYPVINLNGTVQISQVPNISAVGAGDFTFAVWVIDSGLSTNPRIISQDAASDLQFYFAAGVPTLYVNGTSVTGPAAAYGVLNSVIAVRSSGTVTVYTNGVAGTPTVANSSIAQPTNIIGGKAGSFWIGSIKNVLIYNRALSAGEVSALYASGAPVAADKNGKNTQNTSTCVNVATLTFDTFSGATSSGFTAGASSTSGTRIVSTQPVFTIHNGQTVKLTFNATQNSGDITAIAVRLRGDGAGGSNYSSAVVLAAGANSVTLTSTVDAADCTVQFLRNNGSPVVNFTIDTLVVNVLGLLLYPTTPFTKSANGSETILDQSGNSATITLPASGVWISGARDIVQQTVANRPIYLPWTGSNYGWLPGVVGNYFSTPDSAASSITGDIDLIAYCAPSDWTASARVICKESSGSTASYHLAINVGGTILLQWSTNGSDFPNAQSTVSTGFSAGSAHWIRATLRVSDGRVQFFTSSDGVAWTQLGADVTVGATSIYDSSSPVEIGSQRLGTINRFTGKIYRAKIYSGIAGVLKVDFNPQEAQDNATTWVSSTGEVWTVNQVTPGYPALLVGKPKFLFDGSNDYAKAAPFTLVQPEWVTMAGSQVSYTTFDEFYDGDAGLGGAFTQDNASGTGVSPEVKLHAGNNNFTALTSWQIGVEGVLSAVFNNASSTLRLNSGTAITSTAGTNNMSGFTLGAKADGNRAANMTASMITIYNIAPSSAQQDSLINWAIVRYKIPTSGVPWLVDSAGANITDSAGGIVNTVD